MNPILQPELLHQIYSDRTIRKTITKNSHLLFFAIYFSNYISYPTAQFQREIFQITEDQNIPMAVVVAFRGSAKSTIVTMSYPIWAILGKQQKKFVIILSQTQRQARQHLVNLKRELEGNDLLRADLGPFEEHDDEWGAYALVLPQYGAKIMAASSEQSIRGLRHGQYRPDLIIADDVEDLESVKTREGRDKTHQWLTGDVIPAGEINKTKIMVVGNLLHEDSLLMRLKQGIEEKKLRGVFKAYPLINAKDQIAWLGKYRSEKDIESQKQAVGNEIAWQREFLLRIVADEGQLIKPEWIKYYDKLPDVRNGHFQFTATGIDLAISQSQSADYTSMVSGKVYGYESEMKVYILPNPVNKRITPLETIEIIKVLQKSLDTGWGNYIFIEEVGYQGALINYLSKDGINAEGVKVRGQDKRSRLSLVSHMIESGRVLFPRTGAEDLIQQLVGFGIERHDDLADAFAILMHKALELNDPLPEVTALC